MATVKALPHTVFDDYCTKHKITDENVEAEHNDTAFISIICTEGVRKHYLQEEELHWFRHNHSNVLNLEFDDVTHDIPLGEYTAHTITESQAESIVKFLEHNEGKNIICHCRAGMSRSGAIYMFCKNQLNYEGDIDIDGYVRPNNEVLRKLNRILWNQQFNQ